MSDGLRSMGSWLKLKATVMCNTAAIVAKGNRTGCKVIVDQFCGSHHHNGVHGTKLESMSPHALFLIMIILS